MKRSNKALGRRRVLLLVVSMSMASTADAYAITGDNRFTVTNASTNLPRQLNTIETNIIPKTSTNTIEEATRYDLGIGRNLPVANMSSRPSHHVPSSTYEACRYLVEHQAVRELPPPIIPAFLNADTQKLGGESRTGKTPGKKRLKEIQYNRSSQDVLTIFQPGIMHPSSTRSKLKPTMVAHTQAKLNLNTPWVEMLLHHENLKRQGT